MASPQLKSKPSPVVRQPHHEPVPERRPMPVPARRHEPLQSHIQFQFGRPTEWATKRRRALASLVMVALGATGAVAALTYLAGLLAGGIAVAGIALLVGFGKWALDNSPHL